MNLSQEKINLNELIKNSFNHKIIKAIESNQIPWQKPWLGCGKNIGFPTNVNSKKKYSGINFILLQMAIKRHNFISKWWGTIHDFKTYGYTVSERPVHVENGIWGTEINNNEVIYNAEQLTKNFQACEAVPCLNVCYDLGERVLHNTPVKLKTNTKGESSYYYPPNDYITTPSKPQFEALYLGGLPLYYENLAHELMHYSEMKVGFKTEFEAIRELRADIGAAMLVVELGLPHSINFANFRKWSTTWLNFMERDPNLIFKITEDASIGANYILSFSGAA